MELLWILAVVGSLLGGLFWLAMVVLVVKAVQGQFRSWGNLTDAQRIALIQRLSSMSDSRRQGLSSEYMPVREEMAGLAARNGIDPSFLYR
jgi:hypothetical protein